MPKSDRNPAASASESCPISPSILAERPDDGGPPAGRPFGEGSQDLGLAADLVLVQVDGGDEGFLGQEAEAAEKRFLVGREAGPAEGRFGFEDGPALLESGQLADVAVTLFSRDLLGQPLDPALDDGEVAQEDLRLDGGQVAPGVDRVHGVGDRRIAERADDGQEGVGGPKLAQELLAEGCLLGIPGGKALELDEFDGRGGLLLGFEDGGQLLEARIGDLDHGDGIGPLGRSRFRGQARQGGEQRAFARLRQADDADLHLSFPSGDRPNEESRIRL